MRTLKETQEAVFNCCSEIVAWEEENETPTLSRRIRKAAYTMPESMLNEICNKHKVNINHIKSILK